jgi:hypothetical protein
MEKYNQWIYAFGVAFHRLFTSAPIEPIFKVLYKHADSVELLVMLVNNNWWSYTRHADIPHYELAKFLQNQTSDGPFSQADILWHIFIL